MITTKTTLGLVLAAALGFGVLTAPTGSHAADPTSFTDAQKEALDELIRDYIMRHPEVIMDSLQAMQEREELAKRRQQAARVAQLSEAIENDPGDPVIGNPKGDVTLVEFFDYQCGYCKRMLKPLIEFAQADGNLRIVMKEYPILGPASMTAARASLASRKQGKYEAFHIALMGLRGRLTEPAIFQAAAEVGLDTDQLQKDMTTPEVTGHIQKARELADALSIRGTPAFVINGTVVPGAMGGEQLLDLVTRAREKS